MRWVWIMASRMMFVAGFIMLLIWILYGAPANAMFIGKIVSLFIVGFITNEFASMCTGGNDDAKAKNQPDRWSKRGISEKAEEESK